MPFIQFSNQFILELPCPFQSPWDPLGHIFDEDILPFFEQCLSVPNIRHQVCIVPGYEYVYLTTDNVRGIFVFLGNGFPVTRCFVFSIHADVRPKAKLT